MHKNRVLIGADERWCNDGKGGNYVMNFTVYWYWPGSSVGTANNYGLDGSRSNPGGDEIFRPSRAVLGPTQPPVKCTADSRCMTY